MLEGCLNGVKDGWLDGTLLGLLLDDYILDGRALGVLKG